MQPTICKGSCNCMCPVMLITCSPPTPTPPGHLENNNCRVSLQLFVFGMNAAQPAVKNWFPVSLNAREKQHQTFDLINENNLQSALCHLIKPSVAPPCCETTSAKQSSCRPRLIELSQEFTQNGTWYLITSCKLPQRDAAVCRK